MIDICFFVYTFVSKKADTFKNQITKYQITMKKTLLAAMAAALMMTSCSDEKALNILNNLKDLPVEVQFTSNIAQMETRVGETDWEDDLVGIFMVTPDWAFIQPSAILVENQCYFAPAGATASFSPYPSGSSPIYFPSDSSDVQFIAYHPYTATLHTLPDYPDVAVRVDLSDQRNLSALDMLWCRSSDKNITSGPVSLTFTHRMVKLVFNISNDASITEPVENGIQVIVENVKLVGNFWLSNGFTTGNGMADQKITAYGNGTVEMIVFPDYFEYLDGLPEVIVTFTNGAGQQFTAVIPANATSLSVTSGIPMLEWEPGTKYTYNVTLSEGMVAIEGTIAPWTDENGGSITALP